MIPILYAESETAFTSNGLGRLSDVISCVVTEERNGIFELEMKYPVTGIHYDDIRKSRIISAVPADGKARQAFRIYKIEKPINGIVTIGAEHISYQANVIPIMPFSADGPADAISKLDNNAVTANPFVLWTDIISTANYRHRVPKSLRACLGGSQGSFLDVYGGEFEWDNWDIKIHSERGMNNGVVIRYGKNLVDLEQEENIQDTITGILPYWYNEEDDVLVTIPGHVIMSDKASNFPFSRVLPVDFGEKFQEQPTAQQLENAGRSYITKNKIGIPKVSLDVSFVPLWQTDEYRNIANLERVNLCDTVTVEFEQLGISVSAKVIKTEFNVLLERYNKIQIGEAKSNFSSTIIRQAEETAEQIRSTRSDYKRAISKASDLIRGGLGGYVYLKPNADGQPEEILIMDRPDINQAVNVIRMNKNGIAFSRNGYNPANFGTAWTIDGAFNASYITAGTMSANRVRAGTLQDQVGNIVFNLDAGTLTAKNLAIDTQSTGGSFTVDTQNFDVSQNGTATLRNANLINVTATGTITTSNGDDVLSLNSGHLNVQKNNIDTGFVGGQYTAGDRQNTGIATNLDDGNFISWGKYDSESETYKQVLSYYKTGNKIYANVPILAREDVQFDEDVTIYGGVSLYGATGADVHVPVSMNNQELSNFFIDLSTCYYYSNSRITEDNPDGACSGITGTIQMKHPNGGTWNLVFDHGVLVQASG